MVKKNRNRIRKVILETLDKSGRSSLQSVQKILTQTLDDLFPKIKSGRYRTKYYAKSAFGKLVADGLITLEVRGDKKFPRLTEKGKKLLLKYQIGELKLSKPKRWDGKWRVIIFDIAEDRRWVRDNLRDELINLGFKRLQNSVWVTPYPCQDLIIMLKSHFKIGRDVLYLEVTHLENDRWLKEEFGIQHI